MDAAVLRWAEAAETAADKILQADPARRHGGTWIVGVDALANGPDGSIAGVPLRGAWRGLIAAPDQWHRAQLSVIFPGYPGRDPEDSDAAHRFRLSRDAAHVDGLLPEGPARRRHLREPHGFILGLPLNPVSAGASPLIVWRGSHHVMRAAFAAAFAGVPVDQIGEIDVTETYQAARRAVFESCARVPVEAAPGQAILLDRHLLHGVAPWQARARDKCRMIAYFRPLVAAADWL